MEYELMANAVSKQPSTAIVIGASMAGLFAARVLLDHVDRVTIVERDRLPQQPEPRGGVSQANHAHVLLTRGQQILEQLFPGMVDELTACGVPQINWTAHFPWFGSEGWMPQFQSPVKGFLPSRVLLEWLVRQRLTADNRLEILSGCTVKQLLGNDDRSRIMGVQLHRHAEDSLHSLTADLIVDASGRNSLLPRWLDANGYGAPSQTVVNAFLGYSSRWYADLTPEQPWLGSVIMAKPPAHGRGGLLLKTEGDRWVLSVVGIADDCPPTDEAAFLEFVRSLRHPLLYEAIKQSKPVSPIYSYRRTENCWRHYEKLPRFPEGVVALGDAVCAFNPIYGQGMTTAALSALLLDQCLAQAERRSSDRSFNFSQPFSHRFQKRLARLLQTPWMMATSDDFRWETTVGGQPNWITRLMHRYMEQVIDLSTHQPAMYQTLLEVIHMIKPPTALFYPARLFQVLRHWLRSGTNTVRVNARARNAVEAPGSHMD
jgi:2-polyprenyl-6-methoxyphenol hydroxylase-like FAD-dependent oxidoreductase